MPNPVEFNFDAALDRAQAIASEKESRAEELLWGHLAKRAARDNDFRQKLAANPEETVVEEAKSLKINVVPEQLQKAKELFGNPVLPGIDRKKVEDLIFGTIQDVRKSFKLTLTLSQWLFYVGLALLVVAVIFTETKGAKEGYIFGAGGVISLVVSLLMNPLDRIRNAGANLVQIQMAYLAYYNLLYLLGTRGENLPFDDAKRYAEEFRTAAESMVKAVQSVLGPNAALPRMPADLERPTAAKTTNDGRAVVSQNN